MHLYWVFYDVAYDEDVMEVVEEAGVSGFSKWDRVLGKGARSDPRMDTAVWPGFNCALMVVADEREGERFLKALRELKKRLDGRGLEIFRLPAEHLQ